MTWYREWFGEDYLELYAHRDAEEARQNAEFFRSVAGDVDGTILDLACGMGRHVDELRRIGYSVVGCDLSIVLLRAGATAYGQLPVVRADMRQLPFRAASFGALVNFFTSFGYFDSPEEDAAALREMARVLRPGARLLFDFLNIDRELAKLVDHEETAVDGKRVLIERWFDAAARTINKTITIGTRRYHERVRGYGLTEISALFATAGFEIDRVFGDFHGESFDPTSPRLILSCRRR